MRKLGVIMKKLYRYLLDAGRHGSLESLFVADDADIAAAIGKEVNFGEVLGKHSEVESTLCESDFQVLATDRHFIQQFVDYVGSVGPNPLDQLPDVEEGWCDTCEECFHGSHYHCANCNEVSSYQ